MMQMDSGYKHTPQEELEWLVVGDELAKAHLRKLHQEGYEDAAELAVLIGRTICATVGHELKRSAHGDPVVMALLICGRCGKYMRDGESKH